MHDFMPVPVLPLPYFGDDMNPPREHTDTIVIDGPTFPDEITVRMVEPPAPVLVNAAQHSAPKYVKSWDDYVGQAPLKAQLRVYIDDALRRMATLPHTLLASGQPGVGKTTIARLVAEEMDGELVMLVPPFHPSTLYEAAMGMDDGDILFIDEIHKLADNGPAAAENLLHMMEEHVIYLDDGVHRLADFTIMGATTDVDKLPEAIVDRFTIKPYFQRYSLDELIQITDNFADFFEVELTEDAVNGIALACRAAPRVCRDFVEAARSLQNARGYYVGAAELLAFVEVEPDGLTRTHQDYLLALYQFFGREHPEFGREYVAGEMSLVSSLRQTKPGLARLERFLLELGLIDKTPRGRRLSDRGIIRAQQLIAAGRKLGTE